MPLAELFFVDLVRRHIFSLPPDETGWLSSLRDVHIGAALKLLHSIPTFPWTVENLARQVGMSRSLFAKRFVHFVQDSPMYYLTMWRMQLASQFLARQGISIAEVAVEVGYESEAAFNRTFKKCVGVPPGVWRRERRELWVHAQARDIGG